MRRPFTIPAKITGDTASHAQYGVGPASDYALPPGSTIVAPVAGTWTQYRSATGGNCGQFLTTHGILNFHHLRNRQPSGDYPEGMTLAQIAGAGDDPGSTWEGPHLHAWAIVNGTRMSLEEWFASLGFNAGTLGQIVQPTLTSTTGTTTQPGKDDDMLPMVILAPKNDPARYIYWPAGDDESRYLASDKNPNDKKLEWDVFVANGYRTLEVQDKAMAERLVTRANRLWKSRKGKP